jgi:hypothetical protein
MHALFSIPAFQGRGFSGSFSGGKGQWAEPSAVARVGPSHSRQNDSERDMESFALLMLIANDSFLAHFTHPLFFRERVVCADNHVQRS